MLYAILASTEATGTTGGEATGGFDLLSLLGTLLPILLFVGVMYFMMIRPQQKEQKKKDLMLKELAVGDTVLTSSGFYGTIIDVADDTVIVEFGNNKNCRIPMQKAAITMVEKPEDAQ